MDRACHLLLIGDVAVTDAELSSAFAEAGDSFITTRVNYVGEALRTLETGEYHACVINSHAGLDNGLQIINSAVKQGWRGPVTFLIHSGGMDDCLPKPDIPYVDFIALEQVTPELLARSLLSGLAHQKIHTLMQEKRDQLEEFENHISLLNANVGGYVSMLAHDLRSPLSVIKQFASIMQSGLTGDVNAEQQEYLETIVARADGLNAFIGDLLEVSGLELASRGMRCRAVSADEISGMISRALDISLAREEINLTVDVGVSVPRMYCDPNKLVKAVATIALYSCRLTKAGGNISIRVHEDLARKSVIFDVINDGHQIPLERLLQFNQGLNCDVRSGVGGQSSLGLSLYIAKELVRFNLGDIEVRNEAAFGSTFSVASPVYDPTFVLELYKKRLPQFDRALDHVAIIRVDVENAIGRKHLDLIDSALHGAIRTTDLVFRTTSQRWLIVLAMQGASTEVVSMQLHDVLLKALRTQDRAASTMPEINLCGVWHIETGYVEFAAAFNTEFEHEELATELAS